MSKIELTDYLRSNCELKKPSPKILIEVYDMTNGNPCHGCAFKHNCSDKIELEILSQRGEHKRDGAPMETNQQIADRLCISKRQVAKMRKAQRRGDQ